jgi:hypothetical protein
MLGNLGHRQQLARKSRPIIENHTDRTMLAKKGALLSLLILLSACADLPPNFTREPRTLFGHEELEENMAVVLVGVTGPSAVNYLQFVHDGLLAINVDVTLYGSTIIAIPFPVGVKGLTLSTYTILGRRAGYFPSGLSFGYIGVETQEIDIDARGIYYMATLDLANPTVARGTPDPDRLREVKKRLQKQFEGRLPVNFQWPPES